MKKNRVGHCMLWGLCVAVAALCALPAGAVEYEVGTPVALLPLEFYMGQSYTHPFVPSISVPTSIAGRSAITPAVSPTGQFAAFRAFNLDNDLTAIMAVEIDTGFVFPLTNEGDVPTFGRLSISPDGLSVYSNTLRINGETGEQFTFFETEVNSVTVTAFDIDVSPSASGRFAVAILATGETRHIAVAYVNEDGSFDDTKPAGVIATGFGDGVFVSGPKLSADGDKIAFQVPTGTTDTDIYILEDVQAILATPQTSPGVFDGLANGLGDARVLAIRDTPNFAFGAFFDFTGEILIYSEDILGGFDLDDAFGTLPFSDFDILVSNTDDSTATYSGGVVDGNDIRFPLPGNQAMVGGTLDGRVLLHVQTGPTEISLFIAPVKVKEPITASVGGSLTDLSGTTLTLEADQLDSDLTLELVTPNDTTLIQSVSSEFDEIIMGLRQFGPATANFDPPLTIVIPYTDDQILALDPATLSIVVIDPDTGAEIASFDVTNVINDTENNFISFQVTTFGVTGARRGGLVPLTIAITGVERGIGLPVSSPPWLGISVALLLAAGALTIALRRRDAV